MSEKSKAGIIKAKEKEKCIKDIAEIGDESNWSKDQQERDYYYDDSHGYQVYDPDNDSEEE